MSKMTKQKTKLLHIINLTIIILVKASLVHLVTTQQVSTTPPPSPTRAQITTTTTSPTTTINITSPTIQPSKYQQSSETKSPQQDNPLNITTTNTTTSELLVIREEFVDFTEAPTLLFEGSSNENNNNETTSSKNASEKSSPQTTTTATTTTTAPTTPIIAIELDTKSNVSSVAGDESTTTSAPAITEGDNEEDSYNEENSQEVGEQKDQQPFTPPQNVSQYMDYIERLFHDFRHQITDLFEPHIPQLIRTSQMVQLSGSCSYDMLRMALALRQFEPWALRMIDSSGKVPEGILEGSFTALGSYDECLSIVFGSGSNNQMTSSSSHQQPHHDDEQHQTQPAPQSPMEHTQGKYCLVNVSPFLPPKPHADRVERIFQDEANRRNYTKDDQFSRLSGMFYYMKFRIGICVPSSCHNTDLDSIASALSSNLRLNITIPHCKVRGHQPVTNSQLFGGLVFCVVLLIVIIATVIDCSRRRKWNYKQKYGEASNAVLILNAKDQPPQQQQQAELKTALTLEGSNFARRLDKHWSWLSFSLLTNYRLYFTSFSQADVTTISAHRAQEQEQDHSMMVRCLNGIRVLSLCWVIVANSYITLDPRATKRLAQTREAPKDFLFQMVAQASLAIETFFFLSGALMSLSFARKLKPSTNNNGSECLQEEHMVGGGEEKRNTKNNNNTPTNSACYALKWLHFYVHRYIRMTPATMLVIAFTMFAYSYGDGPLWFEATHKAHQSCSQNWWRHLLHVANYIDTRQMCFIHYWYIAADMQLFVFAPLLLFLLYKSRAIGYSIATLIGLASIGSVFYTTYSRNLPPTLLFYNSDPESRREFGNTIMTKPLTHALPYMVGMLVGKWLSSTSSLSSNDAKRKKKHVVELESDQIEQKSSRGSVSTLFGLIAIVVALAEVFLPYKWNNSHLPTRLLAAIYAALFRFGWSLVLAYLVISCRHKRDKRCRHEQRLTAAKLLAKSGRHNSRCCSCDQAESASNSWKLIEATTLNEFAQNNNNNNKKVATKKEESKKNIEQLGEKTVTAAAASTTTTTITRMKLVSREHEMCMCGSGGNLLNRLLSLNVFAQLSKLSFVAYLIHLPLMSVFVAQTRGLFAFSHTLVIHLALSYLMMTFILSFVLVHIIEFPFITFERYLFEKLFYTKRSKIGSKTKRVELAKATNVTPQADADIDWRKEKSAHVSNAGEDDDDDSTQRQNVIISDKKKFNYSERL